MFLFKLFILFVKFIFDYLLDLLLFGLDVDALHLVVVDGDREFFEVG